jgi:hypothetical protein
MRTVLFVVAALLSQAQAPVTPYRTLNDRYLAPHPASRAEWESRADYVRQHVLSSAGLLPLPEKTPLHAVVFGEVTLTDYSVSKVYFESLPGFYVTGNLYRPAGNGPFPAVLSPHGHWAYGRLVDNELASGPGRAINLARQGFVVFTYDMVGYNDSRQLTHKFGGPREKLWGLSLGGLQLWNSIRALDFLESLPDVKRDAIGVTGESGGGTQTFLLAAADPRVAVAVPVNMVSLHMQGGCLCENLPGLRLDINNVEIAAAFAPKPLLLVSATGDWTNEMLDVEYPAVRRIYGLIGFEDRVAAVQFKAEHNYNKDSREAMYAWMARWLKGAAAGTQVAERPFTAPGLPDLLVFHQRPLPPGAATAQALTSAWIDTAQRALGSQPLSIRGALLRHALGYGAPTAVAQPAATNGAQAPGRRSETPVAHASSVAKETGVAQGFSLARRKIVLTANAGAGIERALRSAGFEVRAIRFTPFDAEAASKIGHFDTYNRTAASQRVADIVEALRSTPGASVVASGDEALAAALASAIAHPRTAVLDVGQFDTARDEAFLEHLDIPGLRKAGDLRTASEVAAGRLHFHNAGSAFRVPGADVRESALTASQIVELIRAARR